MDRVVRRGCALALGMASLIGVNMWFMHVISCERPGPPCWCFFNVNGLVLDILDNCLGGGVHGSLNAPHTPASLDSSECFMDLMGDEAMFPKPSTSSTMPNDPNAPTVPSVLLEPADPPEDPEGSKSGV